MKRRVYEGRFAGHTVRYRLVYPKTRYMFTPRLVPAAGDDYDVEAAPELLDAMRERLPEDSGNAYVEYRLLLELTACALLKYDCCILHAVSVTKGGKAYLLAAPSGTGKTTQYRNWQRLFPGEITMISGDMPVLERRNDGSLWAHPSAWNGKEDIKGGSAAPVAGIVILSQGRENRIERMVEHDAVYPLLNLFMVRPETEEEIYALARILDQTLRNIPCLSFTNTGDDASTVMLRDALMKL